MMEISKGLQREILSLQSKLKNAIRDHQICVGKLKEDPKNADIRGQIEEIHVHIVALGRYQKQVVQRLRKEVEALKADNVNGGKLSMATLLGFNKHNNNNHIIHNNEECEKIVLAPANGLSINRRLSKDDYEEDYVKEKKNIHTKECSKSIETLSGDEDIIQVGNDEDSTERLEGYEEDETVNDDEKNTSGATQVNFLGNLGLITAIKFNELQNKRAERKRRSTANSQFLYSNWEVPTKRKRHCYLAGNAPQTRQTTARLNGPSPPPCKISIKSMSPLKKVDNKSVMVVQKPVGRPNILRNMQESGEAEKVEFKGIKVENGVYQLPSKTMHIPGLPSSLTIEKIENDTAVCIYCENSGTLIFCEICSTSYHASCHSSSSSPLTRLCSNCIQKRTDDESSIPILEKNEELEEKEKERIEQRERNSDLRLQVYELEKRSQLLGQSIQLQHRMRQELLGKQEKTQKSIKRLVDFIKLMQHRPQSPLTQQVMAITTSANNHHQVTSSPSQQLSPGPRDYSDSPVISPSIQMTVQSPISVVPICHSLSTSPVKISQIQRPKSPTIIPCPLPVRQQSPKLIPNNNISSLKKYPTPASVGLSVTHQNNQWNRDKDIKISQNHRPSSTITSPVVNSLIQPFESTKSPPPALFLDSIPSHPQKSWTTKHHQQEQQTLHPRPTAVDNVVNSTSPESVIMNLPKSDSRDPKMMSKKIKSWKQMNKVQNLAYSTHCSQAITSPITSPIVVINRREETIVSNQDRTLHSKEENT